MCVSVCVCVCVSVCSNSVKSVVMSSECVSVWYMISICSIKAGLLSLLTSMTSAGMIDVIVISVPV